MQRLIEASISFLKKYERPLATTLFIFGFAGDLLTFGFLELPTVTLLFAAYLAFVIVVTIVAHVAVGKDSKGARAVAVLAPLLAQFTFGSLLSGFLIFYSKSAVLAVSWPFILLLAGIFFGNEIFRTYREHLIFQSVLVFFSIYAFTIFALPLRMDAIGPRVFLASSAISLVAFALYVLILGLLGWPRLRAALSAIILSTALILSAIMAAYFAGLLPPIPLTLKDGGIYQSVSRADGMYVVQGEPARMWWDPRAQLIHHVPGTPLYAYSAIFAPGSFSAGIEHEWQRYDEAAKKWHTESLVAFTLSGGRQGGYRGYSIKSDPRPGEWRVLVKTAAGQTIGELRFTVENSATLPALQTARF